MKLSSYLIMIFILLFSAKANAQQASFTVDDENVLDGISVSISVNLNSMVILSTASARADMVSSAITALMEATYPSSDLRSGLVYAIVVSVSIGNANTPPFTLTGDKDNDDEWGDILPGGVQSSMNPQAPQSLPGGDGPGEGVDTEVPTTGSNLAEIVAGYYGGGMGSGMLGGTCYLMTARINGVIVSQWIQCSS